MHLITNAVNDNVVKINATLKTTGSILERTENRELLQDIRSTDPRKDKERIEKTKGGLLADSYCWILDNNTYQQWYQDPHSRLLWVKGDPGKGKTMLLCGIIEELKKTPGSTITVSYFFCQATDERINSATAVLRGLLYILVIQQPLLASHVRKGYDRAGKSLFEDANAWVALTEIFMDVLQDRSLSTTYLIIDALDECVTNLPELLDFIAKQSSAYSHIKWIVSSRNWPDIETQLDRAHHVSRLNLETEENAEQVSGAVKTYINRRLSELPNIAQNAPLRQHVQREMQQKANGIFLWVSLVMNELKAVKACDVKTILNDIPTDLKDMYRRMMESIKRLNKNDSRRCKLVLSTVIAAYRPLHLEELHALSGLPTEDWDAHQDTATTVRECSSLLVIQNNSVYVIHQSAQDFLSKEASDDIFPCGTADVHQSIFSKSLEVMSRTLHRDMYGLGTLGHPAERVQQPDPDSLASSRYSCIHWIDHLCNSNIVSSAIHADNLQDGGVVDVFLQKKYLYLLEALSLCKSMPKGVDSMAKLRSLVQVCLKQAT
jgi:hypothetical protein